SHFSSCVRSAGCNSIDRLVFGMTVSIAIAGESVKLFKGHSTSGILTGDVRMELIEGDLIETAPARPEHADIIDYISETIRTQTKLKLRVQHPITLPEHSEPENLISPWSGRDVTSTRTLTPPMC
ncbi:MAG: hypothetical protein ACREXW_04880, partial [Gammaproteobacteria bacterium]